MTEIKDETWVVGVHKDEGTAWLRIGQIALECSKEAMDMILGCNLVLWRTALTLTVALPR
jgi:hypothetical protein